MGPRCGSVPRFEIDGARTKGNEKKDPPLTETLLMLERARGREAQRRRDAV